MKYSVERVYTFTGFKDTSKTLRLEKISKLTVRATGTVLFSVQK
jgi:hypothetical protein